MAFKINSLFYEFYDDRFLLALLYVSDSMHSRRPEAPGVGHDARGARGSVDSRVSVVRECGVYEVIFSNATEYIVN